MYLVVILPGLELPVKLRRGLGNGNVVPVEEIARLLQAFDADGDGALTRSEVAACLRKHRVGGAWFCDALAHSLWRTAEERFVQAVDSIQAEALARIIHFTMSRAERPVRRYVLSPGAVQGLEPRLTLEGEDATKPAQGAGSAVPPRPSARPESVPPREASVPRPRPGLARGPRPGPKPRR